MPELPNPSFAATMPGVEYFTTGGRSTQFTLMHQIIEPFSVTLILDDTSEWTFARSMLTDGMSQAVGVGNVRVFPVEADNALVGIAMRSELDERVIVTKKDLVQYFLDVIENFSPNDADYSAEIEREIQEMLS